MRIRRALGFLAGLALLASCAQRNEVTANYDVIPLPQEVVPAGEDADGFKLDTETIITYAAGDSAMERNAELLAEYLEELTGIKPTLSDNGGAQSNAIVLMSNLENENPEAYSMTVTPELITINGATAAGTFYGIQTLRKSVPESGQLAVTFPSVTINDAPRFSYRGAMLDVSRHFFPVDSVKRFIDMLALHNINRFHWHLSEDQGWRIEIKSRPLLTEVGSVRKGTCIGHDFNTSDSIPYGGFYTQDEAREIVKYAADRHITVIPEIDMPGHMLAALTSYPELGCTGGPYDLWQRWGVSEEVLCAGNDSVLSFIDDVLGEITEIFPSEYIHVGGDECPKVRWKECAKCQAKARQLGLKNDAAGTVEEKLQSYLIHHASDFLTSRGRKMIGWDETLEGGLAPGAIVMSWRGEDGAKHAARQGHDAIMTPTSYMYFDYYQTRDRENEPDAIGGYVPVEKVYSFNPVPDDLTPEESKHIIGVQANLWTEYIPIFSQVEYMELPRMAALSEVQWSQPEKRDFKSFSRRVPQLINQYRNQGYRYATHIFDVQGTLEPNSEKQVIEADLMTLDDAPVHYTLDGSEPTAESPLYEGPVVIDKSAVIKAVAVRPQGNSRIFTDSVTFNKATTRDITLENEPYSSYRGNGAKTLVDGKFGSTAFNAGGWLGFNGVDLVTTIPFAEATEVSSVTVRVLVDVVNWILDATDIIVEVSENGKDFTQVATESYPVPEQSAPVEIVGHTLKFPAVNVKAVKVTAKCNKQMPDWEKRASRGVPAFLFVDEIMVD